MSDTYGEEAPVLMRGLAGPDILRVGLLSLAAVIAIFLAASFFVDAARQVNVAPSAPSTAETTEPAQSELLVSARQNMEHDIAKEAPDYAQFFAQLHAMLPAEYDTIFNDFAKQALDGKNIGNVDALLSQAVRALRLSNGILAAKADGPALSHIFAVQLQMMEALGAANPKLCVDFLYGGASPGFFAFSAAHRPLVAAMALAGLDAIGSGRANGIDRAPPSDADFNALSSAMKAQGVNDTEVAAILDGKTPNPPIPDARMCAVGQIYLKALAALPEQTRLRIYALAVSLMARS